MFSKIVQLRAHFSLGWGRIFRAFRRCLLPWSDRGCVWFVLSCCSCRADQAHPNDVTAGATLGSVQQQSTLAAPAIPAADRVSAPDAPLGRPARVFDVHFGNDRVALAYVPPGAGPFAGLFATHGAGGRAEDHLRYWADLLDDEYIIFSIEGSPLSRAHPNQGSYYPNHLDLRDEVVDLVEHLSLPEVVTRYEYASLLEHRPWVYAGYSQGATMGALFALERGDLFDRLILIEGGTEGFSHRRVKDFEQSGGRAILWVCGTNGCRDKARLAEAVATRGGLASVVEMVPGAGHIYWGAVEERVRDRLSWILSRGSSRDSE